MNTNRYDFKRWQAGRMYIVANARDDLCWATALFGIYVSIGCLVAWRNPRQWIGVPAALVIFGTPTLFLYDLGFADMNKRVASYGDVAIRRERARVAVQAP